MSAYYPQIDCVLIDADGERTAAASLTFDIYNVTTSTSEGTTTSNTSGIIASASLGVSDGDILEFSHGTYPGVYRCVAKTLQSSAFSDQGNYGLTYVVENLQTPEDADQAVLIAIDTNSPDARPITLGKALGGTTTDFLVDKSSVSRTWRIYPVSQRKDGSFSQPEYTTLTSTEYEDVTISAFTLGGLAGTQTAATFFAGPTSGSPATPTFRAISMSDLGTGTPSSSNFLRGDGSWQSVAASPAGSNTQIQYNNSGSFGASASLKWDGSSLVLGNSTKHFEIGVDSSYNAVFGHAYSASDNILQYQFKYYSAGGYGTKGIKLDDVGNGFQTVLSQLASGTLYWTDGSGTAGNLSVGAWNNPNDGNNLRARYLAWDMPTGNSFAVNAAWQGAAFLEVTGTTEQCRIMYDTSNYFSTTVGSSGGVTFNAVGSGAKFTFSDSIEVADAKDIVVGTSTGTKIGTSTSQKLGFFNATPVTQRADIGALTDSTGGTPGTTIQDVGGAFDQGTLNDNFASLAAQINALRTEQRDLGFMA